MTYREQLAEILGNNTGNRSAEECVVGAMILSTEAVNVALYRLEESDFWFDGPKSVFSAIASLFNDGVSPIDISTLYDYLDKRNSPIKRTYLVSLVESVPGHANIAYHCQIVKNRSVRRKLLGALMDGIDLCRDELLKTEDLLAAVGNRVLSAVPHANKDGQTRAEMVGRHRKIKKPAIKTGLVELDDVSGGLRDGEMIVLGARPSLGKTSLATAIAVNVALCATPVLLFSQEMMKGQIEDRIIASLAGVDVRRVMNGTAPENADPHVHYLNDRDIEAIDSIQGQLGRIQEYLFIVDANQTPMSMRTHAKMMESRYGLGLIILDYIQRIAKVPDDVREISIISKAIKDITQELNKPFLALSQLSRKTMGRDDVRPEIDDLRGSGTLEQDADQVWLIWNPAHYLAAKDPAYMSREELATFQDWHGKFQVIIGKNRNGALGYANLKMEKEFTRVGNL